jgi:hypothetical protein
VGSRIGGFLRSRHNLAGFVLAGGGVLAAGGAGLVAGLGLLPLAAGLYVAGALIVPRKRRELDPYPEDETDAAGVRRALDQLVRSLAGRVPADIFEKVSSIRASIVVTLDRSDDASIADPNVFLIRQTALSYLPEALNEYLSLPRAYANRSLMGKKSPHDVLVDQLNLMDDKMREVAEAIVAGDAERLESHGRFLADKFGGSSLDLQARARTPEARKAIEQAFEEAAGSVEPAASAAKAGGQAVEPAPSKPTDQLTIRATERARVAQAARAIQAANAAANAAARALQETDSVEVPSASEAERAAADYKESMDRIRG